MDRRITRQINVGGIPVGGGAPVTVQSMTNTRTEDVRATLEQAARLRDAGCDIVRCAVPNMEAAAALREIVRGAGMPVVADIHFDHRLALAAAAAGCAKIRINPGNIGGPEKVAAVARECSLHNILLKQIHSLNYSQYHKLLPHEQLIEQYHFYLLNQ